MRIDAHHHLWDLDAVSYPWLMARGVPRFFGDPAPIQRNYLIEEFRFDAKGFEASVHIQVGAEDPCT
ncbi:MAG: amidohydrolase, partial [Silicimonas sp.]|nr:amidohydrolase [Silicimonas sp.]